jgi:uncharacterized protein involved in tellurium resistance
MSIGIARITTITRNYIISTDYHYLAVSQGNYISLSGIIVIYIYNVYIYIFVYTGVYIYRVYIMVNIIIYQTNAVSRC